MEAQAAVVEDAAAKVWFLAAGTKKIGPMSRERVLERIASGKVPARTKAWREGLAEWMPLRDLAEFRDATPSEPSVAAATAPSSGAVSSSSSDRTLALVPRAATRPIRAPRNAAARVELPGAYVARHRIERSDLWAGIALGFEPARVKLVLGIVLVSLGASGAAAGAFLEIHWALGVLVGLAALPVVLLANVLGAGALSYQTRRKIETGATPGAGEALAFARRHTLALLLTPIALSLLALGPPVLLALKSTVTWIPTVGPMFTGLTFGIDIALTALAFFLGATACAGWSLTPLVVAFESSSIGATIRSLLGLVRRAPWRLIRWSAAPVLALEGLALALIVAAALLVAAPAALNSSTVLPLVKPLLDARRGPSVLLEEERPRPTETEADEEAPAPPARPAPRLRRLAVPVAASLPELTVGSTAVLGWTAVLAAVVLSILVSAANGIAGYLYLGCREGNDELVSRDVALARRAEGTS
jgi:hypothetical protein